MTIKEHQSVVAGSALGTFAGFLLFSYFITPEAVWPLCLFVFSVAVFIASLSLEGNGDAYRSETNLYRYVAYGMKHVVGRLFWLKS